MKVIGNGGHAKVIMPIIESYGIGYFPYNFCFVAIGDNRARKREVSEQKHVRYPVLISPHAHVAKSAIIGSGTVIMAGAVIQDDVRIGEHCIINTGATVDHDCVLEDYVHIAPGASLCGGVIVGEGALVGVCVGIAPLANIQPWTLVKARGLELCHMK